MKAIPITTKNVSVFVAIILMTFGLTSLFYDFSSTIKDKPAEEKVEVKYSKKGLYSYPRYKIHVTNSEQPSTVTREQRSEEHTSELQSRFDLVCRLLLEKKKKK